MWITFISGIGHVGSSVLIGMIGIALGISLNKLEYIESLRGEIVGWMLFAFGILYTIYGIYKYIKNSHHFHLPRFLVPKKIRELQHLPTDRSERGQYKIDTLDFVLDLCFRTMRSSYSNAYFSGLRKQYLWNVYRCPDFWYCYCRNHDACCIFWTQRFFPY